MKNKPFKIIAFDVDGTLVRENSTWVTLHNHFQTNNLAKRNLTSYNIGAIDYPTFMRLDIALWPKHIHVDTIKKILYDYTLVPKADPVIKKLKKEGYEIALISAGIDILVRDVAKKLEINNFVANGLEFDKEGYITGEGIFHVDLNSKHVALKDLLDELGFSIEECIAVGDSSYDKTFLESTGLGITVGEDSPLKNTANHAIANLEDILDLDFSHQSHSLTLI